jgi:DNA-damage-inducible protein J
MDREVKEQFDAFCAEVGMNASVAVNMFAKAVLRKRKLPFAVETKNDPFYSEANLRHLREVIADADAGRNMAVHELIEVSDD